MTIICYSDGILAGDSLVNQNGVKYFETKKIFIIKNFAYGFANSYPAIDEYLKFLRGEIKVFKTPEKEEFEAIKIDLKTKKVYMISSCENKISQSEVFDKFLAIGHGRDLAIGAMEMRASPIQACKIACEYSGACGEPIYCIDYKSKKPEIMKCL